MAKENKKELNKVEGLNIPGLSKEKNEAVAKAIENIEKTFGKGSIMMLGADASQEVEAIPTGSIGLDRALGIGGVPKGRIIEIYGPESSGKTTISLQIAAEAKKNGGQIAMIDAEHALDPTYARALGIDTDNLIVSQPDNGAKFRVMSNCYPDLRDKQEVDKWIKIREDAFKHYFKDEDIVIKNK